MNNSYNYADFIGMSLESDEDYEPYGYSSEALQTIEDSSFNQPSHSIESVIFASSVDHFLKE